MKVVMAKLIDTHGDSNFPERFKPSDIDAMRRTQGSYVFNAQCQLNTVSPEDQVFKREWLRFYSREGNPDEAVEKLPDELVCMVTVDPASRIKTGADYTAAMIHGFDPKGRWFIIRAVRDRLSPADRIELVFRLVEQANTFSQRPVKVIYETISFQETDKAWLMMEQRKRGVYFQIEEIKSHKRSKNDRIRGLQPLFEAGTILWPKKHWYMSKFENRMIDMTDIMQMEYEMFPRAVHDDLLDCHSFPMYMDQFRYIRAEARKKENVVPEFCMARIKERRRMRDAALHTHMGW